MALASVLSATLLGVHGLPVQVDVHVSEGLPGFTVVDLPASSCRELRDRVRAAFLSAGLGWPRRTVTISVSPPTRTTVGAGLDLAIAVALLVADGQLDADCLIGRGFLAELGLDGSVRPVPGTLALVEALTVPEVVVAASSVAEARLAERHVVHGTARLGDLVRTLNGEIPWPAGLASLGPHDEGMSKPLVEAANDRRIDYALEVAAAGGHHLLLVAPPACETSILAERLTGLLPGLTPDEALEVARIRSAAGIALPASGRPRRPPRRSPRPDTTAASLLGGTTTQLLPGELSLAHRGVLHLADMDQFSPALLDNLRQPLDEGLISVSRAATTVTLPARFVLLGAMQPCPCGGNGPSGECQCSPRARLRYARRVAGPLLDRFDLRVEMVRTSGAQVSRSDHDEEIAAVRARVNGARQRAAARGVRCNSELRDGRVDDEAPLTRPAERLFDRAFSTGRLTGRGADAVRRVALTVADLLGDDPPLGADHINTALSLRATPKLFGAGRQD